MGKSSTKDNSFVYRTEDGLRLVEESYEINLAKCPVPFKEHRLQTSYGETYVLEIGKSHMPPLVFLHGGGSNSGNFLETICQSGLPSLYRIYMVDIIGDAGRSVICFKPRNGLIYGDWLKEVFQNLEVAKAAVGGVSLGATIALLMGARNPAMVDRVVALVPPSVVHRMNYFGLFTMSMLLIRPTPKKLAKFFKKADGGEFDAEKNKAIVEFSYRNLKGIKQGTSVIMPPRLKDKELAAMQVPCICYLGEKDPFYKADKTRKRLNGLGGNIKVKIVPGVGHLMNLNFGHYLKEGLDRGQLPNGVE